jgi:hypothetical protein
MRKTTTTRLINQNPRLKKLAAGFMKAHQKFSDDLCRATYRLVRGAAKIGDMVLEMLQESGFKSLRQLHIWLEMECESSIPERTFYRYVDAAKDAKTVEAVHGKEMLTEVGSLKALKMLANPPIPPEPHEGPKPALEEPPPKGWNGQNIRHPSANGAVKDAQPEGDDDVRQAQGKGKAGSGNKRAAAPMNHYHGCKDFRIEDAHTLSLTDRRGERVYIVSEKKGIDKLLDQVVSSYRGKGSNK